MTNHRRPTHLHLNSAWIPSGVRLTVSQLASPLLITEQEKYIVCLFSLSFHLSPRSPRCGCVARVEEWAALLSLLLQGSGGDGIHFLGVPRMHPRFETHTGSDSYKPSTCLQTFLKYLFRSVRLWFIVEICA